MSQKTERRPPLEEGLLRAMQALDKQIAREVSNRGPGEREEHGIQKWEPFEKRVELVAGFVLNELGKEELSLDSAIVLAEALTKVLELVIEDLGEEGLGKIRTQYVKRALEMIERSAHRGTKALSGETLLS